MSEIADICRQFQDGRWRKFIKSIKITNLRGWSGQTVNFKFPVCAIVGENGIGKSTFLRAAACAYMNKNGSTFYPSNLFINTQWDGNSVNGAVIEYVIQEGDSIRSLKWKKTNDWGFAPKNNKPGRHVYFLDISRTLPLDATAGYAKIAKLSSIEGGAATSLNDESLKYLSYVLGKEYSSARFTNTNLSTREVGLLTRHFGEISQFHQGAGEDTILDLFKLFQTIPEQSLLIIDEVEASLHPLAQRRFIRYLLHLARVRKIQIIISTHSPFVLEELPMQARIMLMQLSDKKDVMYDVSVKYALSTIDDINHPELDIYVEDDEAEKLLIEIIKQNPEKSDLIIQKISIKAVGSCNLVATLSALATENKLPNRSLSIIDGDKKTEYPLCTYLPGNIAPEKLVLLDLKQNRWSNLDNRFGIGAGRLFKILDDATLLPDHHDWTTQIGNDIKQSKDYVWSVLIEEWCKTFLASADKDRLINAIEDKLR